MNRGDPCLETANQRAGFEPLRRLGTTREDRSRIGLVGECGDHGEPEHAADLARLVRLAVADDRDPGLLPVERASLDRVGP